MTKRISAVATRALWVLLCLPGLWQLGLLVVAVASRFPYPYDLEWMEGGLLTHAARLGEGESLYPAPSVSFIPYLYTPLYPWLVAALGAVFGVSYQVGRAISVLGIVVTLALMALAIHRGADRAERWPAWTGTAVAMGFFAATYPWLEGWYDLVRADALFVAMILGGLVALQCWARGGEGWRGHGRVAIAGAILGLSFFCKQTGVLYVATGGALLLLWNIRRVPVYVAVTGVIGLGGTGLFQHLTDGWFWTYIYQVHQVHDFNMDRFYASFGNILWRFPWMTGVIAVSAVAVLGSAAVLRAWPRSSAGFLTWLMVFAVSCVVGALGWGTQWAHFNAYLPAMTTGAIACGAAIPALVGVTETLVERWRAGRGPGAAMKGRILAVAVGGLASVLLAGQLIDARWQPAHFVPSLRDRQAGDALIERLREIAQEGDIFMPYHPWYPRLAGQDAIYVHRMGVLDVTYGNFLPVDGLRDALQGGRFAAVVLDNRPLGHEFAAVRRGYRLDETLPQTMAPRTVTGARVAPASVWRPIESAPPPGAEVIDDFEGRTFDDWTRTGAAWGNRPVTRPVAGQGPVRGYRGRYYATSMHGGDRRTGTLTSSEFAITGSRITFRMSGGAHADLAVELHVGGAVVRRAVNEFSTERMVEHAWDVSDLVGETARLVVIDRATGSWGHLNVDQFLIW